MALISRGGGGGSGGSGARATFTPTQSPFADIAARDTWAAANLSDLNNSETLVTMVEVTDVGTFQWSGEDTPASYSSSGWLNINFGSDILDHLSLINGDTQLMSDLPFVTTPTSLIFGDDGSEIASSGQTLVFEGTDNSEAFVVLNKFTPASGTSQQIRTRLIPRAEYTIQPDKTTNSAQNPTFTYTLSAVGSPDQEDRRHTDQLIIESPDSGTITATVRDTNANGRLLRIESATISADTEEIIDLEKPICLEIGSSVHITITGDVRLKGVGSGASFIPFLKVRSYLGYNDQIATSSTMNDLSGQIVDSLESITTQSDKLDASAIKNLPSGSITIQDEGTDLTTGATTLNFVGSGVEATGSGETKTITIDAGISGLTVEDEGTPLNTAATTLNFTGNGVVASGTGTEKTITIEQPSPTPAPVPSIHNLSTDIANRVDIGTDLNVQHTFTFDVTNHSQITGMTLVTSGNDITMSNPTTDGIQSQNVTLSGIDTSSQGTVTFQISATHAGGTITSNTVTIDVRDVQQHEYVYVNSQVSDQASDFSTTGANSYEISSPQTVEIPTFTSTAHVAIAQPATEAAITALIIGGLDQINTFTRNQNAITIGSTNYDVYLSNNPLLGSVVSGTQIEIRR